MREIKKIALMAVGDSAWQGGIQYVVNIINALDVIAESKSLEIHLFKSNAQHFSDLNNFKKIGLTVHSIEAVIPAFTFGNRLRWFLQRALLGRINPRYENYLLKEKFDYVFPATLSDCGGRLNAGAWIADFQYHHFPEGHSAEVTRQAEKTIGFIAKNTNKIILSSLFCENDSFKLFPETRCKTHVMPFSVYINKDHLNAESLPKVRNIYGIEGSFLMVSNLFGATKNHKTLFEALGILRKQGIKIKLVCTGNFVNYAKMEFTNEVLQMITENGIRDQLYILGLIPREHQVALYRLSMAMVQPSINEGWSTCVEEAKALGKTLLLSDIDVHKEQFPDNPFFFEALNPSDLAAKIKDVAGLLQGNEFPDRGTEEEALTKYSKDIKSFGENFLAIASL
jgi:glycosyltransferase involved in cell wall biosynthesis